MGENDHEILLGLTTTPKSDWRGKVAEMKKFGIRRIALFPTFLEKEARRELYGLLEKVDGLEIPHVHLRSDMDPAEITYLVGTFKTQILNTHPEVKYPIEHDWSGYSSRIYVENAEKSLETSDVERYAGLCLDFSHLEDNRLRKSARYEAALRLAEKYPVGCCHVSAIRGSRFNPINLYSGFDQHYLKNIGEIDYIGQYGKYLPKYISLELENTFEEQLEIKKHLEKIINK